MYKNFYFMKGHINHIPFISDKKHTQKMHNLSIIFVENDKSKPLFCQQPFYIAQISIKFLKNQ